MSNSRKVLMSVPEEHRASEVKDLRHNTLPGERTLGVHWDTVDKLLHQEHQVPLQQSVFWTDSTTVLRYIDSETARFKTFVANRISLIRKDTKPSQWMYVRAKRKPRRSSQQRSKGEELGAARNMAKRTRYSAK